MISVRQGSSVFRSTVEAIDFIAIIVAGFSASTVRFAAADEMAHSRHYIVLIILGGLIQVLAANFTYKSWRGGALVSMLGRAATAWLVAWIFLLAILVLTRTAVETSRLWLAYWFVLGFCFLFLARAAVFYLLRYWGTRGNSGANVVIFGDGPAVQRAYERIMGKAWTGFRISKTFSGSDITNFADFVKSNSPDEVWLVMEPNAKREIEEALIVLRHSTANIRLLPALDAYTLMNQGVSLIAGLTFF